MKLFLKGERCFKPSCGIEKRNFPPGQHGHDRKAKIVGYGLQLREKQKVKRIYGVLENQFRILFRKAVRQKGVTGENLLAQLERRLDNVLVRLGFAYYSRAGETVCSSRSCLVNGKKVNIPSFQVAIGQEVSVKEKMKKNVQVAGALELVGGRGTPHWLELNSETVTGQDPGLPKREDINLPIQERMIVELYSK